MCVIYIYIYIQLKRQRARDVASRHANICYLAKSFVKLAANIEGVDQIRPARLCVNCVPVPRRCTAIAQQA